jgi:hypothetical protein
LAHGGILADADMKSTAEFIAGFEGYAGRAYWDVNLGALVMVPIPRQAPAFSKYARNTPTLRSLAQEILAPKR